MTNLCYDMEGNPISVEEWSRSSAKKRRIAWTELPSGNRVSTVWLGLDHRHGKGPPLIFETMVFQPNSFGDLDCERYSTKAEAIKGHNAMVEKWKHTSGESLQKTS